MRALLAYLGAVISAGAALALGACGGNVSLGSGVPSPSASCAGKKCGAACAACSVGDCTTPDVVGFCAANALCQATPPMCSGDVGGAAGDASGSGTGGIRGFGGLGAGGNVGGAGGTTGSSATSGVGGGAGAWGGSRAGGVSGSGTGGAPSPGAGGVTGGLSGVGGGGTAGVGGIAGGVAVGGDTGGGGGEVRDAPVEAVGIEGLGGSAGLDGSMSRDDVGAGAGGVFAADGAIEMGDTGSVSDPGSVVCGSAICDSGSDACCYKPSDPAGASCMPTATAMATCFGKGNGYNLIGCDEPADCAAGETCYVYGNAPLIIQCAAIGSIKGLVVCKSDSDCAGVPCVTQYCYTGAASGAPEYQTLSTCGKNSWCTQ